MRLQHRDEGTAEDTMMSTGADAMGTGTMQGSGNMNGRTMNGTGTGGSTTTGGTPPVALHSEQTRSKAAPRKGGRLFASGAEKVFGAPGYLSLG